MANDAGKQEPPSLDEFSKRLDAARGVKTEKETAKKGSGAAWGQAMRVSTELVVGIFVGVLLGVGLDRALGTSPWLLLLGMIFGFAAGLRNLARAMAAGELSVRDDAPDDNGEADAAGDDADRKG